MPAAQIGKTRAGAGFGLSSSGNLPAAAVGQLLHDFRNLNATKDLGYSALTLSRDTQIGELRSSVRFPIKLPVAVKQDNHHHNAETGDISSGGVLLYVDANMAVGSTIEFSIAMPAAVLGASADVQVSCQGRVVRSFNDDGRQAVAAVIDEYKFERLEAQEESAAAAK
jgi:hypothetical protein